MSVDWGLVIAGTGTGIAGIALALNAREHRAFMRQQRARADLDVTLRLANRPAEPEIVMDASTAVIRYELGIKNHGRRAAGETIINVVVPTSVVRLRWCGPDGQEREELGPIPAPDLIPLPDGSLVSAQYLTIKAPRISIRSGHVTWFSFSVELRPDGQPTVVPIRATAQADELPDEIDEAVAEMTTSFRRGRPS